MMLTKKYFRRPEPAFLLKIGCPLHLVAQVVWEQALGHPVCDWGKPSSSDGTSLTVSVMDRTVIDAFRSHEQQILSRLAAFGVRLDRLVIRLQSD